MPVSTAQRPRTVTAAIRPLAGGALPSATREPQSAPAEGTRVAEECESGWKIGRETPVD